VVEKRDVNQSYWVTQNVLRIIGEEFHAINNDENLWKFYLEDFGPMIFQEKEPKSSGHPKEELQKKFLEDFVLVGQVRFQ